MIAVSRAIPASAICEGASRSLVFVISRPPCWRAPRRDHPPGRDVLTLIWIIGRAARTRSPHRHPAPSQVCRKGSARASHLTPVKPCSGRRYRHGLGPLQNRSEPWRQGRAGAVFVLGQSAVLPTATAGPVRSPTNGSLCGGRMSCGGLRLQAAIVKAARTAVRANDAVMTSTSMEYTRAVTRRWREFDGRSLPVALIKTKVRPAFVGRSKAVATSARCQGGPVPASEREPQDAAEWCVRRHCC
jgi:hypothetical protein